MQIELDLLREAIEESDLPTIKEKLKYIDVNSRLAEDDNETLLSYALSCSSDEVCGLLLEKGANAELRNDLGETILHSIVFSGDTERMKKFVKLYPQLINIKDNEGVTPLYLALSLEKYELFKTLVELDADVNLQDKRGGTPLHFCCIYGLKEQAKLLIEHGADVSLKTDDGRLAISYAFDNNYFEIGKMLYERFYLAANNGK